MVASSVVLPAVPPVTRLPGETRRSPMRPLTGARNSVNWMSSSAWRTAASLLLTARVVGLGKGEIGFGLRQISARLIERVLERTLVDAEQQIALLDDLPVL